jgi:hypothetical protein
MKEEARANLGARRSRGFPAVEALADAIEMLPILLYGPDRSRSVESLLVDHKAGRFVPGQLLLLSTPVRT